MKANEKDLIDGLAKKAFESIVEGVPEREAPTEAAYRSPARETRRATSRGRTTANSHRETVNRRTTVNRRPTLNRRTVSDPFPFVACALALILVIPSTRGMARTAVADAATAACKSGRFDGSEEYMTMVFARGGEQLRQSREKIK